MNLKYKIIYKYVLYRGKIYMVYILLYNENVLIIVFSLGNKTVLDILLLFQDVRKIDFNSLSINDLLPHLHIRVV